MSGLITNVVLLWLALLAVFILHEIGHLPTRGIKIQRWFPIPLMSAQQALSRIGGLMVNFAIILAVFYYRPEFIFFKLMGAVAFFHLVYYLIVGSFYPEPKVPKRFWHLVVFDDVPNGTWPINITIAIFLIYHLGSFYWDILSTFFSGVVI